MKDHDVHSLSHTKWECKYHIVFAPKYRRKVFYGQCTCQQKLDTKLKKSGIKNESMYKIHQLF